MPYPGRNAVYKAVINRMVKQALEQQELAFEQQHGEDCDANLIDYVRMCNERLGHTPWPREIVGGRLILARFVTWENLCDKAQIPFPTGQDRVSGFIRYIEEYARQEKLYRTKKKGRP